MSLRSLCLKSFCSLNYQLAHRPSNRKSPRLMEHLITTLFLSIAQILSSIYGSGVLSSPFFWLGCGLASLVLVAFLSAFCTESGKQLAKRMLSSKKRQRWRSKENAREYEVDLPRQEPVSRKVLFFFELHF